jgi:hypothetical protein
MLVSHPPACQLTRPDVRPPAGPDPPNRTPTHPNPPALPPACAPARSLGGLAVGGLRRCWRQDGRAVLREPDASAMNHGSFCALYSVYGEVRACAIAQHSSGVREKALLRLPHGG